MSTLKRKPKQSAAASAAKRHLRINDWTQRVAAKALGVSEVHLSLVLNGHRISASLLRRINALPFNPNSQWC